MAHPNLPAQQGLYDPANEHDACGVGFVANIKGARSHAIIEQGLLILKNLTHRGAVGADPLAGDGAGILIQVPDSPAIDRKSTRLNSSHQIISYAVFCLKKKKRETAHTPTIIRTST